MIAASLLEFLRSGHLGQIHLDMRMSDARSLLPHAAWKDARYEVTVARSGDIELLFWRDRLGVIQLAGFALPSGGADIDVDPAFVRGGLVQADVEAALKRAGIPFELVADQTQPANGERLRAGPGIAIGFLYQPMGKCHDLFSLCWGWSDWGGRIGVTIADPAPPPGPPLPEQEYAIRWASPAGPSREEVVALRNVIPGLDAVPLVALIQRLAGTALWDLGDGRGMDIERIGEAARQRGLQFVRRDKGT